MTLEQSVNGHEGSPMVSQPPVPGLTDAFIALRPCVVRSALHQAQCANALPQNAVSCMSFQAAATHLALLLCLIFSRLLPGSTAAAAA